jgi:hypothetical protein
VPYYRWSGARLARVCHNTVAVVSRYLVPKLPFGYFRGGSLKIAISHVPEVDRVPEGDPREVYRNTIEPPRSKEVPTIDLVVRK